MAKYAKLLYKQQDSSVKAIAKSLFGRNNSSKKKAILSWHSKIKLADELEISSDTVQNFFAGKPIGRENFHKICKKLKLPLQEITDIPDETELQLQSVTHNNCNVDTLITELRNKGRASIYQNVE